MLNSNGSFLPFFRLKSTAKYGQISLLFVCVGAVHLTAQVAILHPSGAVSVNNVAVNRPVPVFSGDKITTGNGATATIQASGTQVALSPGSSVVYGDRQIDVLENGATVSTLHGMTARFEGMTVSPTANTASQFEIRKEEDGTRVIATSGSVSVTDGKRSKSLNAGDSVVHESWNPANLLASNHNSNDDDTWRVESWHHGGGGGGGGDGGWGGDDDRCRDRDRGHKGHGGDNHDCECRHEDHHGHPESPIRPCRGDRHDEHCRCEDRGRDRGW